MSRHSVAGVSKSNQISSPMASLILIDSDFIAEICIIELFSDACMDAAALIATMSSKVSAT